MAADLDMNAEIIRIRERLHSLGNSVQGVSGSVLLAEQAAASWQKSHDKLDEERNANLHEKLSELKGMLETIPIKLGEDLATEKARTDRLERAYWQIRGVGIFGGVAVTVLEILHFIRGAHS